MLRPTGLAIAGVLITMIGVHAGEQAEERTVEQQIAQLESERARLLARLQEIDASIQQLRGEKASDVDTVHSDVLERLSKRAKKEHQEAIKTAQEDLVALEAKALQGASLSDELVGARERLSRLRRDHGPYPVPHMANLALGQAGALPVVSVGQAKMVPEMRVIAVGGPADAVCEVVTGYTTRIVGPTSGRFGKVHVMPDKPLWSRVVVRGQATHDWVAGKLVPDAWRECYVIQGTETAENGEEVCVLHWLDLTDHRMLRRR